MKKILNTPADIRDWLMEMEIKNYTIRKDNRYSHGYVVDVASSVNLDKKCLSYFPVQFGRVDGFFSCIVNQMTSLKGAPLQAKSFDCHSNQLTSLRYCPLIISEHFNCSHNKLTSLRFSPKHVGGDFNCSFNPFHDLQHAPQTVGGSFIANYAHLSSLLGCPQSVGRDFHCENNQISNLLHVPQKVNGHFYCSDNPLLGSAQETTEFKKILALHLIEKEKQMLSDTLLITHPIAKSGNYKI